MSTLVTGVAGFIGFHVVRALVGRGETVIGIDNLQQSHNPALTEARRAALDGLPGYSFERLDVSDLEAMRRLFASHADIGAIVHLAGQAGVRYSAENPYIYLRNNIEAFVVLLESCRVLPGLRHLVYASSSSVYGANNKLPFSVEDKADSPVSLYGATKKAMEVIGHSYARMYEMRLSGLRFFTVYGPWGRPDMAMFKFAKAMLAGEPIDVYNHGDMRRDFTYVDDVVEGIVRVADRPAEPDPAWTGAKPDPAGSNAPYRVYNIGNNSPVELLELIATLERELGITAKRRMLPMQPGDVPDTYADVDALMRDIGFRPSTPLAEGVKRFVAWYREYYGVTPA